MAAELIRGLINNFSTTLVNSISNSATTFDLTSVTGIAAELVVSDFVEMTIDDGTNVEIIHVTGVSGSTVTAVRGQEGTAGTAFAADTTIECRLTRQTVLQVGEWRAVEVLVLGADQTNIDFIVSDYPDVDHKVQFCGVTIATDAQDLRFVQGTGGTPTYQTTTYYHSGNYMTYLAGSNNNPGNNASQLTLMPTASNSALNTLEGTFEMANPSNAAIRHVCDWNFRQQSKKSHGAGVRDTTEAVTAFRFKMASGDFKAGSKFIRYIRTH